MSTINAQIDAITVEMEELGKRIDELRIKRSALAKLQNTYNETLQIVADTAAIMVTAGLDPKVLAQEIRQLIAPRKSSKAIETTEEYEVIEVPQATPAPTPTPTPAPTPVATPEPVKTEPTVKHNRYGLSVTVADTSSKNYGRVEAKKTAPKTDDTPKVTPTPTDTPTEAPKPVAVAQETASNDDVTKWSMTQLKEYVRKYWTEADVSAFMKDGGYKKVEKLGWIKIVMRIRANASKKAA